MGDLSQQEHPQKLGGIWVESRAQKPAISPKHCKIGQKLLWQTNRKSHTRAFDWHQNQWPWTAKMSLLQKWKFHGAHQKNLNEDRPILSEAKCRSMILVYRKIRFVRIFAGGAEWQWGSRNQVRCSDLSFKISDSKAHIIIQSSTFQWSHPPSPPSFPPHYLNCPTLRSRPLKYSKGVWGASQALPAGSRQSKYGAFQPQNLTSGGTNFYRAMLAQSAVMRLHVVCLSVCNVQVPWPHRLEFSENNFTAE